MTDDLLQDLRFAGRTLRKAPLFAALVVGTLGLGIGANTAIFSVVNGVLLRPLPYEDPGRIAMVFRTVPRFGFDRSTASYPDFADWRAQSRSFSSLAAYGYTTATYLAASGAERLVGYRITADLLPILGVAPVLGREFLEEEDRPGAAPAVILSHRLWQSRFGGDHRIIGRAVTLDGEAVTVQGVMPAGFAFPSRSTQFWVPLRGDPNRMERDTNFLTVIGRLAPGVSVSEAQAQMAALAARVDATAEAANKGYGVFVEARHAFEVRNARTALLVFLGAVALVLIVACANVANLILSRSTSRRREIALRIAIGAGPGRLARQLMTESLVLATLGGLLGLGVAVALLRLLVALGSTELPRLDAVGIDPIVLGFTLLVSLSCGLAFGTAPAVLGARADVGSSLKGGAGAGLGRWATRLQRSFVVAQVALAITLSIGAGLLINSFARLTTVEPGFDPTHVVAARVVLPRPEMTSPPGADQVPREELQAIMMERMTAWAEQRSRFFEELRRRAGELPGVQAAGLAYGLPFSGSSFSRVLVPEGMEMSEGEAPVVRGNVIDGDYFGAMRIPLLRGRAFSSVDAAEAPLVAVINETMADLYWPGEDPIGKRIRIGDRDPPWTTVVGVVADVRQRSLAEERQPMYYGPLAQARWVDRLYLTVRATTPAAELVPRLRGTLRELDPELPLTDIATAGALIDRTVASPRFRTIVLGVFGALAAVLALIGIYGVISYAVSQRTREIGVRIALGARRPNILGMVLGSGLRLAAVGVVLGIAASLALTRFLSGMLFGLTPYDATTFAVTALLILGTAALACYLPARRAATVDPLESLRYE